MLWRAHCPRRVRLCRQHMVVVEEGGKSAVYVRYKNGPRTLP
jgi:hypothetical protein